MHLCVVAADIDECRTMIGICENGRCRNVNGGFTCVCQPGYQLTGDSRNCRGELSNLQDFCIPCNLVNPHTDNPETSASGHHFAGT